MAPTRIGIFALQHPRVALAIALLAVALLAIVGLPRFAVTGDLYDLLPRDDPEVRNLVELAENSGASSRIIVVLEADSAARIEAHAEQVTRFFDRVAAHPKVARLERGVTPEAMKAISRPASLLLLDPPNLARMQERLSPEGLALQAQELASRMADADAMVSRDRLLSDPLGLADIAASAMGLKGKSYAGPPLPDGSMPYRTADGKSLIAFLHPAFKPRSMEESRALLTDLRALAGSELEPAGVHLALTGTHALTIEIADMLKSEIILSMAATAVTVFLVFLIFYRRVMLLVAVFTPIMLAIVATGGVAGILVGSVHFLAAAFGDILIGVGMDYGTHYVSHLVEKDPALPAKERNRQVIYETSGAMLMSMLTTAGAFSALLLSGFPGFAQLGLLIAIGMVCVYLLASVILPVFFARKSPPRRPKDWFDTAIAFVTRRMTPAGKWNEVVGVALTGASLLIVLWPPAGLKLTTEFGRYEPPVEGFRVRDRLADSLGSIRDPWIIAVDAETLEETLRRNDLLFERLRPVAPVFLRGATVSSARFFVASARTKAKNQEAFAALDPEATGATFRRELEAAGFAEPWAQEQERKLADLLVSIAGADPAEDPFAAHADYRSLFEPYLRRTPDGYQATTLLFSRDGWEEPGDEAPLETAVEVVPAARVGGTGPLRQSLHPLFMRASIWLLVGVLVAMSLVLRIGYGRWSSMAAVSLPIWAGLSMTAAVFKLADIPLGFGNLCVFPLVVGICLDSSLYLASSSSHLGDRRLALLEAGRPIVVSAISNAFCFGTLLMSSHPGLRELGGTTLVGVLICCTASLFLFPGPLPPREP